MVKSRAEICRDYRRRLKERNNDAYLRKERERRRRNYVPSECLSLSARTERQRKTRDAVRRCRLKKRHITEQENGNNTNDSMDTSGYDTATGAAEGNSNMIVAMRFPRRAEGPRLRQTKELRRASALIDNLKKANIELAKKLKTEQRKRQRIVKRLQKSPRTPKSKAEHLMKDIGLTSAQKDKIRKELVFSNVIVAQLHEKKNEQTKATVGSMHMLVAGQILRKYRLNKSLCSRTGFNKTTTYRYSNSSNITPLKERTSRKFERMVLDFFERDDNSRNQPGKADAVKCKGDVKQTRVLTDYLNNLHLKFLSENPDCKVSFSTFCRIRPKYIQLCAFISRSCCLCTKHQNMVLTTKTLRKEGFSVPTNPEKFINSEIDMATLQEKLPDTVILSQWKRIEIEDRGKRKHVMRIQDETMSKHVFVEHLNQQTKEFSEHVNRVNIQYSQIKCLKENLPNTHVAIHMDFAENYMCRSSEEIQSAYFNQTSVTIHPVVIYFRDNNELKHNSLVLVSDTLHHNASTVATFLDTVISEVKQIVPNVTVCHYWTDSPTSQYRNKLIFDVVANHKSLYDCCAVWNYFEAGHGKGPCDGLGGTVKRMADTATKTGKFLIQNAKDLFQWATEKSSFTNVSFRFISDDSIAEKVIKMSNSSNLLRPIKGTMKLHAVAGEGSSKVLVRETSCYCEACLFGNRCTNWKQESTRKVVSSEAFVEPPPVDVNTLDVHKEDFVAAIYDGDWFLGKIIDIDMDDGEIEVSFMEKKKSLYQWPRRADRIWVNKSNILCIISEPIETGKTKRMYKISDADLQMIQALYSNR